jgi:predicted lactoylglutathione lyase
MKGQMIGYVTVGTNDLKRSKQFYDNLFEELGARSFFANERIVFWTVKDGASSFAIAKPYDEKEASVGNGNMVAIHVNSREQVDAIYAKAMELGATDEGPPGERIPTFYGAYIRDLDGNKLVFYKMTAPEDEKSFMD